MRIVVVGPGALGCLFAGLLSKKAEVWLLDKDPVRAEKIIAHQGVTCQGVSKNWQASIPATARAEDIGPADLIILCTKAYDTKEAIQHAQPLLGKNTHVLTLQNGWGNVETIAEIVGEDMVLAGMTNQAVTLTGTAQIEHTGAGETIIGHLSGKIPASVRQIREVFNKAKIPTKVSRNIKGVLWSKLIVNAGINALSAILRLRNGQLNEQEEAASILSAAIGEAIKVARRKRIKLIYDDPLAKVEAVCQKTSGNVSSMLQDVLAGRRTEIDYINGVIVKQGRLSGVPTPVNQTLCGLVKGIERSYSQQVKAQIQE